MTDMHFTAESELVTFHTQETAPKKQTISLDDVPDTFDWRLHAHLAPLPYHPCSAVSPTVALVMAVQCLQDRWAIWHNLDMSPTLSVPYTANIALGCGVDVHTINNAWCLLQQHGTVDTRKDGYRVRNVYKLAPSIENIRRDIYNHGPITTELQVDARFETYCTTLTQLSTQTSGISPASTPPVVPIYTPPLNKPPDNTTTTLAVTIIGWGRGRHSSEPDFWIVGTTRGAQTFAKRNEYGVNGYMLVAANGQLEQHCMAAFPFFSYMGVKQPLCCQFAFQPHLNINVHGPIQAVMYRNITANTSTPLPAPITLKSGKRCKRPFQFHTGIEIQKDALTAGDSFNTPCQAWASSIAKEIHANPPPKTTSKETLPPKLPFAHNFMKWCVEQPGEIIAICLLIVGCVLACVACSMI